MFGATILVAVALVGYTYFSPRLRQVSSATFGDDPTAPILASEVGRFPNFSLIQITGYAQSQFGPPTVAKLLSDIAEARNADYCIALKIWNNADGSRMSVVGFTNKMDANIEEEFGDGFRPRDEVDQSREYVKVSDLRSLVPKLLGNP
jgi:hypothetical protein